MEILPNHSGKVTCKVLPAIKGTVGVKLNVLLELAPVTNDELLYEHEVITDGQNWIVVCPVPRTVLD